jgi:hypothetical protein
VLFSIQIYIEEYLNKRNLIDSDGYAVHLANIYYHHNSNVNNNLLSSKVSRIKTVFFLNNNISNRKDFEYGLIQYLGKKIKKNFNSDKIRRVSLDIK